MFCYSLGRGHNLHAFIGGFMLESFTFFVLGIGIGVLLTIFALMKFSEKFAAVMLRMINSKNQDQSDWWKPTDWSPED